MRPAPLPRAFFDRPTVEVARALLGCRLVRREGRRTFVGRVVETEAYCGSDDLACHASKGRTPRTEVMFGPPGHAYVYLVYGLHHLLNVVTERPGTGSAVLFRALEPLQGFPEEARTDGPARLTKTIGVDAALNRHDLTRGSTLWLEGPAGGSFDIASGPRIGVDYAGEWAKRPWRFWIEGTRWLSVPARGAGTTLRTRARVVEPRRPSRRGRGTIE